MELTDSLKALFLATARSLIGRARRLLMARTVKALGPGGQRNAERALGWSRGTIRQGLQETEVDGVVGVISTVMEIDQVVSPHITALSRVVEIKMLAIMGP